MSGIEVILTWAGLILVAGSILVTGFLIAIYLIRGQADIPILEEIKFKIKEILYKLQSKDSDEKTRQAEEYFRKERQRYEQERKRREEQRAQEQQRKQEAIRKREEELRRKEEAIRQREEELRRQEQIRQERLRQEQIRQQEAEHQRTLDMYRRTYEKTYLMTVNERNQFNKINRWANNKGYLVFTKVRLLDLIIPRSHLKNNDKVRWKIQSRHVDFVICDKDIRVKAIIEIQDSSHKAPERKERDEFVRTVLEACGYKLIETYNITEEQLNSIN